LSRSTKESKRVLIVQALPGIGDMVWHIPFIKAICRFEDVEKADVVAEKRSLADQILAMEGLASEVLWLDDSVNGKSRLKAIWHLAKALRARHYDRVWILHYSSSWCLAAFLAGIPKRWGYGLGAQKLFLNGGIHLANSDATLHPIDKAVKFLQLNGMSIGDTPPRISVSDNDLSELGLRFEHYPKPWIAFGIGATDSSRQWGENNFGALAKSVLDRVGGTIFLLGGKSEGEMAERIKSTVEAAYPQAIVPVISYPIHELCALLKMSAFFVGNDSGMLNLSSAVGTPSIGLFGIVYRNIDTHRIVDEKRNIYAVFPNHGSQENKREPGVSYMHQISVASVSEKLQQLFEKNSSHLTAKHDAVKA
jgi:heptosyltransferase-2